ncbi:MAG: DNA internalization-related competence protein ComEC/Rec2 [Oscillospiraceae bacterium]|nr:DNA internalization-related competence protein ComEC/Rec2 [Oscillospiraceae bacterium]
MRILLWFALGFGAACACAAYLSALWPWLAVSVIFVAAVVFLLCKKKKTFALLLLVLAGFLTGTLWYRLYSGAVLAPAKTMDGFTGQISVTCSDYSHESEYGSVAEGMMYVQGKSYRVRVYLKGEKVTPGDRIQGVFRMRYTAPGGQQDATFHKGEGIFLLAYPAGEYTVQERQTYDLKYVPAALREKLLDMLERIFPTDTEGFARALLLGDSSRLSYETMTDFSVTGIRHVIAVSGLHVAILFSFLGYVTGKRRLPMILIGVPVLALFAAMAGFTPSIVRACIMQLVMLLALLTKREYDTLSALAFAVLAMLVANPLTVTSVSFQLSVGSMVGILVFSGKVYRRVTDVIGGNKGKSLRARLVRFLCKSASVSISAMVFTTPLAAFYFGTVSLIGVISNVVALWVISFTFCGILIACLLGFLWLPLGSAAAWVVSFPVRYVLQVSAALAKFPLAAVYTESGWIVAWLVLCYGMLGVYLLCKGRRTARLCFAMVLSLCLSLTASWLLPLTESYRITVLDVGQGQCILLQSDGRTYMVDCGGDYGEDTADLAARTLLSQGIGRLDGMILTHFDEDHSGGAGYFLSRIPTDLLILPNMPNEEALASKKTLIADSSLQIAYEDTFIAVFASDNLTSGNESSLCVLFQAENCDILITGDRSMTGELELLQKAAIPDLEYLVAGHHGAAASTGTTFLNAVKPETVLISVGKDNDYGHPAEQTLQRIEAAGAKVLRTDEEGTIIIRG